MSLEERNQVLIQDLLDVIPLQDDDYYRYIDWYNISIRPTLSHSFIRRYCTFLHWDLLCSRSPLELFTEEFLDEFAYEIEWIMLSKRCDLTEEFISQNHLQIYFRDIPYEHYKFSTPFLCQCVNSIYWTTMPTSVMVPEEVMHSCYTLNGWDFFSRTQKLTVNFIREHTSYIHFGSLYNNPYTPTLPYSFLRRYKRDLGSHNLALFYNKLRISRKIYKFSIAKLYAPSRGIIFRRLNRFYSTHPLLKRPYPDDF